MRIIRKQYIDSCIQKHAGAASALRNWLTVVRAQNWQNFNDLRNTFPSADAVTVHSGRAVVVFNLGGNSYRLIAGIHYPHHKKEGILYTLRFLTHAEYSKDTWKSEL